MLSKKKSIKKGKKSIMGLSLEVWKAEGVSIISVGVLVPGTSYPHSAHYVINYDDVIITYDMFAFPIYHT